MGFEQLAALKEQLVAEAKRAQRDAKPSGQKKPRASAPKQSRANQPPRQRPAGQQPAQQQQQPSRPQQPPRDPLLVSIGRLQKHFPAAFPKKPDPKVPLKLGVSDDLCARSKQLGLTEDEIKLAVATWCKGTRYWNVMLKDAPRLALDGTPDGVVTEAESAHATFQLRRHRRAQVAARKTAERDERQEATEGDEAGEPVISSETAVDTPAGDAKVSGPEAVGTQADDTATGTAGTA